MKIAFMILVLIAILLGIIYLFPQINYRDMPPELMEGHLPEEKPNWVSSKVDPHNMHYIAPLTFQSLTQLASCIEMQLPQVKIKSVDSSKLIAYRASTVFHFVDWLCIHADGTVTSTATMGHSDFGKNRELIEEIRNLCHK
jgi:uncharacterized protein (DUF1499 family)